MGQSKFDKFNTTSHGLRRKTACAAGSPHEKYMKKDITMCRFVRVFVTLCRWASRMFRDKGRSVLCHMTLSQEKNPGESREMDLHGLPCVFTRSHLDEAHEIKRSRRSDVVRVETLLRICVRCEAWAKVNKSGRGALQPLFAFANKVRDTFHRALPRRVWCPWSAVCHGACLSGHIQCHAC